MMERRRLRWLERNETKTMELLLFRDRVCSLVDAYVNFLDSNLSAARATDGEGGEGVFLDKNKCLR